MNALRKILLPLLIIPFGMLIYVFLYPNQGLETSGIEYLFLVIGVPIVVINLAAWFYPEFIKAYFPVKEDWGQGSRVIFAVVGSALIAAACVGVGAASAIANVSAQPTFEPSGVLHITATAFARSVRALASATKSSEDAILSTPRQSPTAAISTEESSLLAPKLVSTLEPTLQIPVSGGDGMSSPTLSVTGVVATPTAATSFAAIQPTATVNVGVSCPSASAQYMEAIGETVQDVDSENVVVAGWMAQSNVAQDLWFVAAKIESDTGTTSIGVWGVFGDSVNNFDVYAINEVAMDLSYAAWGEDSDPVLTMQSNGAQTAYDCAARAG